MFEAFLLVLVVANVLPILPVILQFTEGLHPPEQRTLLVKAVLVGNVVALLVALAGGGIIHATRLTLPDLRIAGGTILLVFAVFDLLFNREQRKRPLADVLSDPDHQLVPMAVPLLVGPAVLTTVLVVAEDHGRTAALIAVAGNAAINLVILLAARPIFGRLGGGLGRALGKVMSLVLAALAVSMVRTGILEIHAGLPR